RRDGGWPPDVLVQVGRVGRSRARHLPLRCERALRAHLCGAWHYGRRRGCGSDRSGGRYRVNIAVVGTGYVGLVAAACFAETGNTIIGADVNAEKVDGLTKGIIP